MYNIKRVKKEKERIELCGKKVHVLELNKYRSDLDYEKLR